MFKHLVLPWLLPIFGMFFAAGADALAGGGNDTGAIAAVGDAGEGDLGVADAAEEQTTEVTEPDKPLEQKTTEEPEVQEFKGAVSARLRSLTKQAPELTAVFQKYPKLQEQIEATFRREAALREVFPTVAEARQLRDALPNGLADLQQLQSDIKEVEELDNDFYQRDNEGNYPGHVRIVENMFKDDREAAISLFRSMPKEWARLDRDSYNEVMGKIVGATFANAGIIDFVSELAQAAKEAKQDGLTKGLNQLLNWAQGYLKEKPQPSEEEQRLSKERQSFTKEKQDREKEDGQRFHSTFVAQSKKLQTDILHAHPAVKTLLGNKAIPEAKKNEIIEQVRKNVESLLGKSPSFMRKLNPAYKARNLQEVINLQKAAWSEQWRINSAVRTVFSKEIPQLVQNNRASVQRRAGAPQNQKPVTGGNNSPQGPKQIGGIWYRDGGKGARFTTAEVLAGKHLL